MFMHFEFLYKTLYIKPLFNKKNYQHPKFNDSLKKILSIATKYCNFYASRIDLCYSHNARDLLSHIEQVEKLNNGDLLMVAL